VIPRAIYQLTIEGRKIFALLSNIQDSQMAMYQICFSRVILEDQRLVGIKTHDCYIIMQDLMPLALCRSLSRMVTIPLIRLCNYFKVLYGKVLDPMEIEKWEA
jgi:hypothetical protein